MGEVDMMDMYDEDGLLREDLEADGEDKSNLINSVQKILQVKKKGGGTIRREAAKNAAEFSAIKRRSSAPTLNKLLASVKEAGEEKTADKVSKLVKTPSIKPVQTLQAPLEKPQALKAKRTILYENAKEDVSRWNAIVYHNRNADQLVYPLISGAKTKKSRRELISDSTPMTPLEEEMARVLYGEAYLEQKKALLAKPSAPTDSETYNLSVEEAMTLHSEMARLRALQSYQMAKAKRQNKIKSKKYHRLLRKEKIRKQLKDFQELQEKDPDAALEKLEELNKSRVEERMSLKHRNTSKWAKMQAARAKYSKDSRVALSEQLKISRDLTQKVQESSEESDGDLELPSLVKSSLDNPWMLNPEVRDNDKMQLYYSGYKKLWDQINAKKQKDLEKTKKQTENEAIEDEESNDEKEGESRALAIIQKLGDDDSDDEDEEQVEKKSLKRSKKRGKSSPKKKSKSLVPINEESDEDLEEEESKSKKLKLSKSPEKLKSKSSKISAEEDGDFTELDVEVMIAQAEDKMRSDANKELKKLTKEEKLRKRQEQRLQDKLKRKFKSKKRREGDSDEVREIEVNPQAQLLEGGQEEESSLNLTQMRETASKRSGETDAKKTTVSKVSIDPNNFLKITKKSDKNKFSGEGLSMDLEDEDSSSDEVEGSQRQLIAEAFEDDDIVSSFKKRKDDEIEAGKPKDVDLSLPGWGQWGGKGVKINEKKRQRFIIKAPKKPMRKDAKLSHVILNEEAGEKIKDHQVRELPFPFKSVKDYEKTIRAPIGRTFLPEASMKSLTAPRVITRLGAIIKPLDEEVLVQKNKFQVPTSIKTLAKVRKSK